VSSSDSDPDGSPGLHRACQSSENGADEALTPSEIIDLERAQIGHDLHDQVLPLIFAAAANLQPLLERDGDADAGDGAAAQASRPRHRPDEPALARVERSCELLQQALSVGRNLLTQIYPPELDQLSWLAAAKDTAARIAGDDCDVLWHVNPTSPVNDAVWDRDVATAAYRVMIEAIRNAVAHGNADSLAIRCGTDAIRIVDDGDGFDPSQVPRNHFGIRAMKSRARLVGKQVSVESEPGGPTTVTFWLQPPRHPNP